LFIEKLQSSQVIPQLCPMQWLEEVGETVTNGAQVCNWSPNL
jgi:hypothetical protein